MEKLTGIRAHTLRAWEQRYDLITPRRSKTNIRFYLEDDLRKLSTVAVLNKNGHRISKIAEMSEEERSERVASLSSLNVSPDTQLDVLTLSVVEMDAYKFGLIVDTNIEQRGFEETMMKVIYPFIDKLGLLYFTGSVTPVQESFVAGMIRQKILAATDALPATPGHDRPVFALFLPEGERQDLSMLFIQHLMKKRGFAALYLGTGIAPTDLGDLCRVTRVDYLLTLLSNSFVERPVDELVAEILDQCPEVKLLLSGYQASLRDFNGYLRVEKVAGLHDMFLFLDRLSTHEDLSTAEG